MGRELGNNRYSVANVKSQFPNRFEDAADFIVSLVEEEKKKKQDISLSYISVEWSNFRQEVMRLPKPKGDLEMRDLREVRSIWLSYINESLLQKGRKMKCFAGKNKVEIWLGGEVVRKTEVKMVRKLISLSVNQTNVLNQIESAFPRYSSIPFFKQQLLNVAKIVLAEVELDTSLPKGHKEKLKGVIKEKLRKIEYQKE